MKVEELRKALLDLPPDMEVMLQKDAEGNGYNELRIVDTDGVRIGNDDVYSASWSADDASMDPDEWAEALRKPRCLVLSP